MVADPTTTLQVKNTGSLSVNRYGWINIWMAILGQFFTRFPLFFESCLILLKTWLEIFPDNAGILRIYLLQFSAIVGYKTRRAAHTKAHDVFIVLPLPAGLKSEFWLVGSS